MEKSPKMEQSLLDERIPKIRRCDYRRDREEDQELGVRIRNLRKRLTEPVPDEDDVWAENAQK